MLIEKLITTTIDLVSDQDIYSLNLTETITNKLTQKYVGVCYSSMLITNIKKIVKLSERYMANDRLDGTAYVDVQFKAEGIILVRGEVIHGCTVVNISNSGIVVKKDHIQGFLKPDANKRLISIVKKNQQIPVMIHDVRYNPGESNIVMTCIPFSPMPFPQIFYNITQDFTIGDDEKLASLVADLEEEEKKHSAISETKSYQFFSSLIYPYKTTDKFQLSNIGSSFKPLDLKAAIKVNSGCLVAPDLSKKSFILHSPKTIDDSKLQVQVVEGAYSAFNEMIMARIRYLITVREFCEMYDTPEKTKEMMTYWKICESLKE